MSVITISRQMCSLGDEIAAALAERLGWELIDRGRLISDFAQGASPYVMDMLSKSARFYLTNITPDETYLGYFTRVLRDYTREHGAVLLGFASQGMFAREPDAVHVRVTAPEDVRAARLRRQYRVSAEEAGQILSRTDRKHRKFVYTLFNLDISEPSLYDLILNTARLSVEECVSAIIALHEEKRARLEKEGRQAEESAAAVQQDAPVFKNASEQEFAKILDMYHIEWKYEPKTFPIEWDAEGNVTLAFSPDFYLPKFDTYIELTTMNQKYVSEKNKKVRKLRELYPGTNIKIIYKKDYHSLIERFKML